MIIEPRPAIEVTGRRRKASITKAIAKKQICRTARPEPESDLRGLAAASVRLWLVTDLPNIAPAA
jgi:hypothetical protein